MKLLKERSMKKSKALVFDIQRFAIHDGKGIRTTVFFKGCPLRCKWCQNPEGLSFQNEPVWFEKECIHCRLCEKNAENGDLIYDKRPLFQNKRADFSKIIHHCPAGAIQYAAREYTPQELLEEAKKDQCFYGEEGGITFSGGEPFGQPEMLKECVELIHENGFHTAVESSFMADWQVIEPVLPYLDQIFADIKIFNSSDHQKYTGVENKTILENLTKLLKSKHALKATLRTPLIPGITDTEENIDEITKFIASVNPDVHYEMLPYNVLAPAKYKMLDQNYPLADSLKKQSEQKLKSLMEIAVRNGLKHVICEDLKIE